ncbi:MAG: non-canonical purine NTP pyrophosphatase [Treponema sp.]|jgi:XTP/dITP diphosphohydrolase|nr:non-canonical purine NTP pyrophosphatase [Treponema sp.]
MTIWLASGNGHKKNELAAILGGHVLKLPGEGGIADFDPPETGSSFMENALLKARALYRLLEAGNRGSRPGAPGPVLADDSGLCVDALGGRPGIHSARYGSETGGVKLDSPQRNALLLEELGAASRRDARFVCAMVLLWSPDRFYAVQETLEGEIVSGLGAARGSGGFGYDPLVYLPRRGCTVAELTEEEKNRLSHRGKAGRAIAKLLAGG